MFYVLCYMLYVPVRHDYKSVWRRLLCRRHYPVGKPKQRVFLITDV